MIVAEDETGDVRFTGTLDQENSDAWLRGLSIASPVRVIERDDARLAALSTG